MSEQLPRIPAVARLADQTFFRQHRDRRLRIREPIADEYSREFSGFGMHDERRRRIIVSRLPPGLAKRHMVDFMRIPFLLFADETVEDRDDVLAPILEEIMREAAAGYGMPRR